jgi:drug/metabolite transporter (DMT)-like permease
MIAGYSLKVNPGDWFMKVSIHSENPRAPMAAMLIACIIWGSSFHFGKIVLHELTVSQLVFLRFSLGSLALIPVLFIRCSRLKFRDIPVLLLTSFLAIPVTYLLQFHGLAITTITRASLILGTLPPLLALGGALFFKERPGVRGWIAVLTSMLGVLVMSGSPEGGGSWVGDGLVFLSTLAYVIAVILIKHLSQRLTALVATTYMILFGTLMITPFVLLGDGLPNLDLTIEVWLSVLVLGLFCTAFAYVLWNWGLERTPTSLAGIFTNFAPLVGALFGVSLWRESISAGVILGGILIMSSALLVG